MDAGSGKSDHPNDDRKGQPEKLLTDTAESSANSAAVHPGNPFENWDQPLLSFSSRSSSSDSDLHEHSATEQPKEANGRNDSIISNHSSTQKTTEPDRSSSGVVFFNPRRTPPIQVMDRSENYDPSRIPVSVFTPKSSSPMDWSVASNESLFSLQVGNNSFNRDHFLMMGVDLPKSGELFKLDELNKSGELYKSGELFSLSPSTPITIPETTIAETRESTDNDTDVGTPKSAKSESPHKDEHPQSQPVSTNLSTKSSHSDGSGVSGASIGSFAFPILTEAKRDSTEKDEPVAVSVPQKQMSKSSMRKSISAQLSAKMPSCNLCCCYCSCSCLSWRPRCWRSFCC